MCLIVLERIPMCFEKVDASLVDNSDEDCSTAAIAEIADIDHEVSDGHTAAFPEVQLRMFAVEYLPEYDVALFLLAED